MRNQSFSNSLSSSNRKTCRANNTFQIDNLRNYGENMQGTTAVNGLINYDKDNFLNTCGEKFMDLKNIMNSTHFWERINAFFKLKISAELEKKIKNFYNLKDDKAQLVCSQLSQFSDLNFLEDPIVRDAIKLTNDILKILTHNDQIF